MNVSLAGARRALVDFFHEDDSAVNLGVTRIFVFLAVLKSAHTDYLVTPTTLPHELMRIPIGMGWLEGLIPTTPEGVMPLIWLVRVAALAAALGIVTRVSTVVTALGVLILFVVPNCYGHVAHVHHHLVWFTAILAASRCGDALSIDAWWRRRGRRADPPPGRAPCYGFPLRAMAIVLGVSYFCTGVWKVIYGGPEWLLGNNLTYLASKQAFIADGAAPIVGDTLLVPPPPLTWAEMVTSRHVVEPPPWLGKLGGLFTLVFELGFIFAALSRAGRLAAALAGAGFHNFTRVFAGIGFDELLLCYPFLIDVDGWTRWLRSRLGRGPASPEPARGNDRPSPVLVTIAAALMLGTLTFGALRIGAAWPVSCAPRFDTAHSPIFSSYVVSGVLPDGTRIHVRDGGLGGRPLGPRMRELFRGRQYHVAGVEQPDGRLRRWQVLCAYVWNHHPSLVEATDVRFSLVDIDLSDGSAHARLLGERELVRCDRADAPGRR